MIKEGIGLHQTVLYSQRIPFYYDLAHRRIQFMSHVIPLRSKINIKEQNSKPLRMS